MNYQSNQKYTKYFYLFSTDKKILLFKEKKRCYNFTWLISFQAEKFIGTLETPIKTKTNK